MGSRFGFIISVFVGILASAISVQAQPDGYRASYTGSTHPISVNLDDDFGRAGVNGVNAQLYEFGYLASDPAKEWPVCGEGTANPPSPRIPVSADGSFTVSDAATVTFPNAFDNLTLGPRYLKSNNTANPVYAYRRSGGNRCACLSDIMSPRASGMIPIYQANPTRNSASDLSNTTPRFYPSTYEDIASATSTDFSSKPYGPVAVSNDPVNDPRSFERFHPASGVTTFSVCSCPNLNEKAVALNSGIPDKHFGSVCTPMITAGANRVLAPYAEFPTYYQSHILSNWKEKTVVQSPMESTILLPKNSADLGALEKYSRRIWTCAAPFEPDLATGNCVYNRFKHACGESSSGVVLSPYGEAVGVANNATFQKLANKKLACCLNSHMLTSAGATQQEFPKYDCSETKLVDSAGQRLDFNAIWAGSDDTQDGGQLNALALVSAVGQPITGFYSLRGTRCGKFSEFGGELRPKRVRPFLVSSQQANVAASTGIEDLGSVYPLPTGAAYQNLKAGINKGVPTTLQEMNECPILVRAALVVTCPPSNGGASLPELRLQEPADATVIRCPTASSVTVHLRIEQLYQIAGQTPLKTFDTRAMKDQITNLAVADIIGNRFGETCLPGTRRVGDLCTY